MCARVQSVSLSRNLKFLTLSPTRKSHTKNDRQRARESEKKELKRVNLSLPLFLSFICGVRVFYARFNSVYLFTTNLKISEVNFPPTNKFFRKKIFTCVIRAFLFRSKRVATSFRAPLRVPLVSLRSRTSASAARCAFVRVSQSLRREEIRARVYLFTCM